MRALAVNCESYQLNNRNNLPISHGANVRAKKVEIKIKIVNDYEYINKVLILFLVSFLGLIIPMLARAIFDVENVKYEGLKFKYW